MMLSIHAVPAASRGLGYAAARCSRSTITSTRSTTARIFTLSIKPAQSKRHISFTISRLASQIPAKSESGETASIAAKAKETFTEGVGAPKLPPPTKFAYPERLCVYHAGTGRVTFLACLKVSTLFIFTFFACVVTPLYLEREGLSMNVLRTTASAVVPLAFVAFATSPFVTFIHLRLPPYARQSEDMLRRFITYGVKSRSSSSSPSSLPPRLSSSSASSTASSSTTTATPSPMGGLTPTTELEITTMSLIAKPRLSIVKLGELQPTKKRFGIVNFVRDTTEENKRRKWYMYPAVANFSIQESSNTMPKVSWVWGRIAERIGKF